jgi:hypothetical protein
MMIDYHNCRYINRFTGFFLVLMTTATVLIGCAAHHDPKQNQGTPVPQPNTPAVSEDTTQQIKPAKKRTKSTAPVKFARPQYLIIQSPEGPLPPIPLYETNRFSSKILDRLETGARLEILDRKDNWLQVKTAQGKKGWINIYNLHR